MQTIYDEVTPESIKREMLSELKESGAAIDVREGSYSDILISQAAYQNWKLYQKIPELLLAAVPDETSGHYIDAKASDVGMSRTKGTKATVQVKFSGMDGVGIPEGTALYVPGSGLRFTTTAAVTIAGGAAVVAAEASEIGADYNVGPNTVTSMSINITGVSNVTNPEGATGGTDDESDVDFYRRLKERFSIPSSSGNAADYVRWAKETPGIGYAACVPLWNGPGTVKVVVGSPSKQPVDSAVTAECAAHIEALRPVGAAVTVVSAEILTIHITATVLTDGGSLTAIEQELTAAVSELLSSIPFASGETIRYSRLLSLLLVCEHVLDYKSFLVNGGQSNLALSTNQVPVVGKVTVSAGGG